ncbi:DUF58 domain-containing protein [Actinophytocola xinjiangensis]|uniref:DUF58 domain-containing protein n=1 Tax=Actinophytocola xinjiangensis TaxID=485602 RepID=UPI0009FFF858|nr:DUF58 domain-containing protein [Actinophytocola xinjiangensis]
MAQDTSRWARWTVRGTGTFLFGAVLTGAGVWWRYPGVVGLGAGFVALAAVGLASVAFRAQITMERAVSPTEVVRYRPCVGTMRLRHAGRGWPVHLDAEEQVGGEALPVRVLRLRAGERAGVDYEIPTTRRGILRVGPLRLRRHGLAGLATREVAVGDVVEVRVLPRRLPVRGLPAGGRRGQLGTEERVDQGGSNLTGLREYTPGDDLRKLHWATSARTGTLIVREDADPARPHLAVLLDDRAASYRHPEVDFEDAIEVATSLATRAAELGHPVRLRTVSGSVDVYAPGSMGGVAAGAASRLVSEPLADLVVTDSTAEPDPLPVVDRDIVAVITGTAAEPHRLALVASGAPVAVVLMIDLRTAGSVTSAGRVVTLRGPRAEELLGLWDRVIVG